MPSLAGQLSYAKPFPDVSGFTGSSSRFLGQLDHSKTACSMQVRETFRETYKSGKTSFDRSHTHVQFIQTCHLAWNANFFCSSVSTCPAVGPWERRLPVQNFVDSVTRGLAPNTDPKVSETLVILLFQTWTITGTRTRTCRAQMAPQPAGPEVEAQSHVMSKRRSNIHTNTCTTKTSSTTHQPATCSEEDSFEGKHLWKQSENLLISEVRVGFLLLTICGFLWIIWQQCCRHFRPSFLLFKEGGIFQTSPAACLHTRACAHCASDTLDSFRTQRNVTQKEQPRAKSHTLKNYAQSAVLSGLRSLKDVLFCTVRYVPGIWCKSYFLPAWCSVTWAPPL